jgi:hypothetical protein
MVQLSIHGAVQVVATALVAIAIHGCGASVTGGNQTIAPKIDTAERWCEHYGVKIEGDRAILYKGLKEDFTSPHGMSYSPGSIPVATDWDGGKKECGGGLHFSPHPVMTEEFIDDPKRFCACPVLLSDISVHPDGEFPQKVKARGCCAPVWEVDQDGEPVVSVITEAP